MNKIILYPVVFICGGAVLAVEILGTRIIGPYYGVSIFLWSALISVTLVALSAGYMIGGRIADRKKNPRSLAVIIAAAGVITVLIPLFRNSVISLTESIGLRASVLVTSFILFFPPLTFLGMVSPFAVKLRTQSLDVIGTRAGDLYAVSTMGSVLAALLTGYILIPNIGVIKLTISVGIILIITSVILFFSNSGKVSKAVSAVLMIIIAFVSFNFLPSEKADPSKGLIAVKQSMYGEIRVMDVEETRLLLIDGGIHTAIDKTTGENILPYAWVIDITKKLEKYTGDMLLIGLGGGSVLKSFYEDDWDVTAVEVDPEIIRIEKKYFTPVPGFDNVINNDGRDFLRTSDRTYDLIVLDAFGSSSIPFHLTTLEAFRLAKSHINEDGIMAVNIEAVGWNDIIVGSLAKTLHRVFDNVLALPIAEPPDQLGNVILLASDNPFELTVPLERDYWKTDYRFSDQYERNHAWDNRFVPDMKDAVLLTDDLNPVDIWAERINLQARKELHEMLGAKSFLW